MTSLKKMIVTIALLLIITGCGFLYGSPETKIKTITDLSQTDWQVTDFEYTNQFGEAFGSENLKGQYWLANMIFARCPTVCTVMTPNMIVLQQEAKKAGIDIQFVSFTVDPEFDGPEGMKKYGEAYGADFSNYHFLSGYTLDEITEFAKVSFKSLIQEIPNSADIMHSVKFFLVDGDGKVIRMYDGNNDFDEKVIIKDLKSITR